MRMVFELREASLDKGPGFGKAKLTPIQQKGIRYEKKVGKELKARFPEARILSGQWIKFWDLGGVGFAQPDHVLLLGGRGLIVEAKLSHTDQAREQLELLYAPLCSAIWPEVPFFSLVEAACNYRPGSWFNPLEFAIDEIEQALEAPAQRYHYWQWRP